MPSNIAGDASDLTRSFIEVSSKYSYRIFALYWSEDKETIFIESLIHQKPYGEAAEVFNARMNNSNPSNGVARGRGDPHSYGSGKMKWEFSKSNTSDGKYKPWTEHLITASLSLLHEGLFLKVAVPAATDLINFDSGVKRYWTKNGSWSDYTWQGDKLAYEERTRKPYGPANGAFIFSKNDTTDEYEVNIRFSESNDAFGYIFMCMRGGLELSPPSRLDLPKVLLNANYGGIRAPRAPHTSPSTTPPRRLSNPAKLESEEQSSDEEEQPAIYEENLGLFLILAAGLICSLAGVKAWCLLSLIICILVCFTEDKSMRKPVWNLFLGSCAIAILGSPRVLWFAISCGFSYIASLRYSDETRANLVGTIAPGEGVAWPEILACLAFSVAMWCSRRFVAPCIGIVFMGMFMTLLKNYTSWETPEEPGTVRENVTTLDLLDRADFLTVALLPIAFYTWGWLTNLIAGAMLCSAMVFVLRYRIAPPTYSLWYLMMVWGGDLPVPARGVLVAMLSAWVAHVFLVVHDSFELPDLSVTRKLNL
ncbi:hypothetical protein DL98DRAFT_649618 [Cadophora sp. DSE1049]|nr:hypothetical protein DL98DRAFT_649618 [Cadophora sp. DSE1049]